MEVKTGDIVKIKVNGKEYDTIIDQDNVQRFIGNSLIRHFVDSKQIDINRLHRDFHNGKFKQSELMDFYMGLGYSVCGFDEVFGINSNFEEKDQAEIENPLWD